MQRCDAVAPGAGLRLRPARSRSRYWSRRRGRSPRLRRRPPSKTKALRPRESRPAPRTPSSFHLKAPDAVPAPPTITLPKLTHFEHASYPKAALDQELEGSVDLFLDIDAAGHVTKAVPVKPIGYGFDEAASEAAMKFEFEPAKRGGSPIPSRIRYKYNFTLEKPSAPPLVHVARRNLGGRVLAAGTNAPLVGATVAVRAADGTVLTSVTGSDGAWGFEDAAPGTYHFTVRLLGYVPDQTDESVEVGKATEHRLPPLHRGRRRSDGERAASAARGDQVHGHRGGDQPHPGHERRRHPIAREPSGSRSPAGSSWAS